MLPEIRRDPLQPRLLKEGLSRASPPMRLPTPSPDMVELVDDVYRDNDDDVKLGFDTQHDESELLHKTVDLLSAHKLAIAEMVEVME